MIKIPFYFKIQGAFKDEINSGDNVIAQSPSYSREISRYDLADECLSKSHSLLTSIHVGNVYYIGHYQGLQVEFSGNTRAYSTRSVFELHDDDLQQIAGRIGSAIASLPQMPIDGYTTSDVNNIPIQLEASELESKFTEAEKLLIQSVEQAFYTQKKLYVKISLNKENAYAKNLQENKYLLSWLYCLDNISNNVKPYVHFAFGTTDTFIQEYGTPYLVYFYDENDVKEIPQESLNIIWEEDTITAIGDTNINVSYEKFNLPIVNDYNLADLYEHCNAKKKEWAEILKKKHQVTHKDLNLLLEIYNNNQKEEKKAEKKLLEFIHSEQTHDLIAFLSNSVYKTEKLKEKQKEFIIKKLIHNNCETLEELLSHWTYIVQVYSCDDNAWNWNCNDVKFTKLNLPSSEKQQFEYYLEKLEDCSLKKAIIEKADKLKPKNIDELQKAIADNSNNDADFLRKDDIFNFFKVISNNREDGNFVKKYLKCIKWLRQNSILSEEQRTEIDDILKGLDFIGRAKKFVHTYPISITCVISVLLLICSNIISYRQGRLSVVNKKVDNASADSDSLDKSKIDMYLYGKHLNKDTIVLVNDTCSLEDVLQKGLLPLSVDSIEYCDSFYHLNTEDINGVVTTNTSYYMILKNKIDSIKLQENGN